MARFLGIDIGDNALRGALVRSALRKLEIERYVEIPLTELPDSPGRLPELNEASRNLLRALGATPDAVVAALAGEETSLRVIELPAAARKRIGEVLPFELEAVLPYDPHDAIIDYQPIAVEQGKLRVLAAAALRPHVAATLERLRQIGFEPRELAAGAAALDGLTNLLPELKAEGPLLLLDVADRRTDLCFLHNGHCVHARTIDLGIEHLPESADQLQRELQRTLAGFRTTGLPQPLVAHLSGSGALAEGAVAWLSSALGVPVNPLSLPAATHAQTPASPVFGKAAALAVRGAMGSRRINLRSGEFAHKQAGGQLIEHVNLITTCIVIVVMTVMFSLKARQALLAEEQQALHAELASVTKKVFGETISDPVLAEARVKNPKASDPLPRFDAYDALAAVSAAIAPEINHEVRRLLLEVADEKREGRMELQGVLESLSQRDQIVSQLGSHPCFHEIELGKTTPMGNQNRINYQIEAVLVCPGEGGESSSKNKTKKTELE